MPTGHLGTLSFNAVGGAGTGLNIISITPNESSNTPIPVPYLSLAKGSNIPYEEGEVNEGGEIEVELADDNNTQIVDVTVTPATTIKAVLRKVATCILTKPPSGALTNGATRTFSGIMTSDKDSQWVTGTRGTITIKIKVAGNIVKVAGT